MQFRTGMWNITMCLFAALAITLQLSAQDNPDHQATIITFDAPGAGTNGATGQGTLPTKINPSGAIVGLTRDANDVRHGFLRSRDGSFTIFDAPGAGTSPFQGTRAYGLIPAGTIAGYYDDASSVSHGYVRAADGTITTFDAPGAGTSSGQGTLPFGNGNIINPAGAITGYYVDSSSVGHGFVRAPGGTITFGFMDRCSVRRVKFAAVKCYTWLGLRFSATGIAVVHSISDASGVAGSVSEIPCFRWSADCPIIGHSLKIN